MIKKKLETVFRNKEHISLDSRLDRCWFMKKEIQGYSLKTVQPEIIERSKRKFKCENCGYLVYEKL